MADKTHNTDDDATRADRLMGREDESVTGSGDRRGSGRRGSSRLSRSDYARDADKASGAQSAAPAADGAGHSDAGATGSSTSTTAAAGAASSSARTDDERTNVSNTTTRGDADNERTQAIDTERTQPVDTERTRAADGDRTQPLDTDRTRNQSRTTRGAEDRTRDERLYRDSDGDAERTRMQPAPAAAAGQDEVDRDAERERRRREREEALGTRRKSGEVAETEPVRKPKRTTDKFFGAFGLFLLRLVVAAIMGGHGLTKLSDIGSVQQMLSGQPLVPMPEYAAWVLAICEVLIAIAMVFGLAVRFAGLGTAIIAILALSLVKFAGMQFFEGYTLKGELELLLAAVGIMFLFVGGGSWGFDGALRRRKSAAKS